MKDHTVFVVPEFTSDTTVMMPATVWPYCGRFSYPHCSTTCDEANPHPFCILEPLKSVCSHNMAMEPLGLHLVGEASLGLPLIFFISLQQLIWCHHNWNTFTVSENMRGTLAYGHYLHRASQHSLHIEVAWRDFKNLNIQAKSQTNSIRIFYMFPR